MMDKSKQDQLKARLIVALLRFFARRRLATTQRLASWLGALGWRHNGRLRKVTEANLRACFPTLSEAERQTLGRASVQQSACTMLELGLAWLGPLEDCLAAVRSVSGEEHLQAAIERGQGAIVLAPHLGNWEILNLYISSRYPFTALYAPPKIAPLDAVIRQGRSRAGATLVPTDRKGVMTLLKRLREGQAVGILPDQEPDWSGGLFAPFFGVPAFSPKLVSRLVEKTGARVISAYAKRLPDGQGFDIVFQPADERIYAADEYTSVLGVNASVEACVQAIPQQYQWEYKRFRKRPEGTPKLYQFK